MPSLRWISFFKSLQRRPPHAHFIKADEHVALIQNTEDDPLSKSHGDGADPEVDLPAAHFQFDPSILREAVLGDIELCHDFNSGDQLGLVFLGRGMAHLEDAVDPVADTDPRPLKAQSEHRTPLAGSPR